MSNEQPKFNIISLVKDLKTYDTDLSNPSLHDDSSGGFLEGEKVILINNRYEEIDGDYGTNTALAFDLIFFNEKVDAEKFRAHKKFLGKSEIFYVIDNGEYFGNDTRRTPHIKSQYHYWMQSLVDCGWPQNKLAIPASSFNGLVVTLTNVVKEGEEKKELDNGKLVDKTVTVVGTIHGKVDMKDLDKYLAENGIKLDGTNDTEPNDESDAPDPANVSGEFDPNEFTEKAIIAIIDIVGDRGQVRKSALTPLLKADDRFTANEKAMIPEVVKNLADIIKDVPELSLTGTILKMV